MRKNAFYGAVSFRYAMLDCYKKLGLKENEVMVILVIDHLLEQGNRFVEKDALSLRMALPSKEIDAILSSLLQRKLIAFETDKDGSVFTSLEPIREKVYAELAKTMDYEKSIIYDENLERRLSSLSELFEKHFGRTLSPLEHDTIGDWVRAGYTDEEIKDALKDALKTERKTVRNVSKILKQKRIDADLNAEGASAVSETWDQDIAATMEIAKAKWGIKNDD